MAPLPRLLVFCDFLEILLHTTSLALLRRMFTDFYTGNEHTLQDFMRLGATVISVLPMQRKGPQQLKEAARLLAEQKKDTVHATSTEMGPNRQNQTQMYTTTSQSCVFRYLSARVASRNILWLRDMFHEFCRGENALLREFLRRGDQAISVIPVDIQALLAHRYGLPACLQYMESEAFKRFPMVPGQNRNIYGRVNGKSRSMWSSSESLRPILDEIVSFKAKTKDSSNSVEL
ncbi:hypothetical protein JG687_00017224 [Phytophthora cactorum]|uniref:Thioredoxin-like fold n=1 Tax=Phytophthora cactorum TaxID=29920 RepID=A0A8T1TRV9_9STRA|nr:hypothetical protein JG687_00017224 [Phytophthora cactorum]